MSGNLKNGYYGQASTLDTLSQIDLAWQALGSNQKIVITEISQEVGSTPGHSSHQEGQNVDIRPISINGSGSVTYKSSNYDPAATQRLVDTILRVTPKAVILFNDPNIKGVKPYTGHNDHLHVTLP